MCYMKGVIFIFSTVQKDFLESFIPTLRSKGYSYYVAYTNTNVNNTWNSSAQPDLYIVASSDKITASSGYRYTCQSGSVRYSVRTANYSTSNNAVNSDRVTSSNYSGVFTVNAYEHIYTNAEFTGSTLQPDILYSLVGGYHYEATLAVGLATACLFIFIIFRSLFRIGHKC